LAPASSYISLFWAARKVCVFGNLTLPGKRTTKCKVKGITLNYENSKVVNFTALRDMILEDAPPVHVHNPKIKRKHGDIVVSEPETKEYKVVFKKRRLMDSSDSLPYGY